MRIDWCAGTWRVWTLDGVKLYEAKGVSIRVPVELVNADRDHRGYLIFHGVCRMAGDKLIIEPEGAV